jgi:hypothetical protein
MKKNIIKIALGMVLAIGSAHAERPLTNGLSLTNGYYFQHVSKIVGNLTAQSGPYVNKITVINQDQTWTSDTIYILDNLTFVEPPAVLTIEPGTIVRGAPLLYSGTSTLDPSIIGDLNICRGAKIVAKGTALSPIIMTSFYDPLVPGGAATIPHEFINTNGVAVAVSDSTISTEAANYSGTNSTSGAINAHKVDAKWGSLTLLGRAVVGFGGPTGQSGVLQVGITTNNRSTQGYTENPTFTFDPSSYSSGSSDTNTASQSGFNLEALFNPVPVASVYMVANTNTSGNYATNNNGVFTGVKPILSATAADGSRTAIKTILGTVTMAYNFGMNGIYNGTGHGTNSITNGQTDVPSGVTTGGDDFWEVASVGFAANSSTDSNVGGLQYNVPSKKDTVPFVAEYGYSGAQVAFAFSTNDTTHYKTNTTGVSTAVAKTTGSLCVGSNVVDTNNGVWALPVAKMKLSPTYLYGVIVKAPAAYGDLSGRTITLGVSKGSNVGVGGVTNNATAVVSISSNTISDPSAIPLKGGIGANFIEGKQSIDGGTYGLTNTVGYTFSGGIYGGGNNGDNSGTVNFVQLRHGGYILSPNNEINGLTFGGVGSGTSIEYVEVFNNADDDFEMFGGAVDLKHVAAMFSGDDCFDTDMGYRGHGQYMFACQNNTVGDSQSKATGRDFNNIGDNLGENDGNEDPNFITNLGYPGTDFCYFNTTMIGIGYTIPSSKTFPSDRQGPNFKDNSGGKVFNSLYIQAPSGAMADQSTTAVTDNGNGVGARRTAAAIYDGFPAGEPQGVLAFNTWSQCGGGKTGDGTFSTSAMTDTSYGGKLFPTTSGRTVSGGGTINSQIAVTKTLVTDLGNEFVSSTVVRSLGSNGRLAGVDPTLPASSVLRTNGINPRSSPVVATNSTGALTGATCDRDTFYAPVTFRGAFKDFNWMKGWTHTDEIGVFATNNVAVPNVTLSRDSSGNVVAIFPTESGIQYIIETSSDNKKFIPYNSGSIVGNGNNLTNNLGIGGTNPVFVRVTPQ